MLRRPQTINTIVTELYVSLPIRHGEQIGSETPSKEASSWCSGVDLPALVAYATQRIPKLF